MENDKEESEPPLDNPPPPSTAVNAYKKADTKATSVLWISIFLFSLFTLGMYDFLSEDEPNRCGMSYMYEVPQYIRQREPDHPKYGLYAYGEGKLAELTKKGKFSGIPVLFIPGNAGSHRQVRSVASIALRKAIDIYKYKTHFDYFAVDFNEEFSALFGGTLIDQADFVRKSIKSILSLYSGTF